MVVDPDSGPEPVLARIHTSKVEFSQHLSTQSNNNSNMSNLDLDLEFDFSFSSG